MATSDKASDWFMSRPMEFRNALNEKVAKMVFRDKTLVRSKVQAQLIAAEMQKTHSETIAVGVTGEFLEVARMPGFDPSRGVYVAIVRTRKGLRKACKPTKNSEWNWYRPKPGENKEEEFE